ncbi:hypothetical protein M408DRAFT_301075 [Serendipita vermifera MAFF 305830]|uniref:F-box domain-containing protein n=1 Tax=Serendipita vermifera MAFF 305830 TaxID=933852 RepID=A0A0C2W5P6_SERVB|nr:hypothetical protein M408DRAFT_301075 [Serendipita vermifera MAFF 305830]
MERIRALKEQHNMLVDEGEERNTRRLVDPLQALPPELWTEFLPRNASELLVLTLVCDRWRTTLLSAPILWTFIELDGAHGDYLCEAIMGLTCSSPLEISLNIKLPLEEWRKIAPLIVEERSRVARLNIRLFYDSDKAVDTFEMLLDFGSLPKLTTISLPDSYTYPPLLDTEPEMRDPEHGYPCDETVLAKLPLLSTFTGFVPTTNQLQIPGISKFKNLHICVLHDETVLVLQRFQDLKNLRLVEERNLYKPYQSLPFSLYSSLSSLESFYYYGLFIQRALPCIGTNLRWLNVTLIIMKQIPEILLMLSAFPKLFHLSLDIDLTEGDVLIDYQTEDIRMLSVTSLHLMFLLLPTESGVVETGRKQALEHLFHSLIVIIPSVEELVITGETFQDAAVEYIQNLQKLRFLTWATDYENADKPPLALKTDCLDEIHWHGKVPRNGIFDIFASSTLRSLQFSPPPPRPVDPHTHLTMIPTLVPRCKIPDTSMPNLTTLILTVEYRLAWDLNTFPRLKRLGLAGNPSAAMAADIFEELALQPSQCPLLEEIELRGAYAEWDLLLLMLERRNLINKPGISRIHSFQLDHSISYKLLRPIVELLGGKYPHRDSLAEYSSTAVGKLVWDKKLSGCQRCCRTFQSCSKELEIGVRTARNYEDDLLYEADLRLGLDYPASLESIPADPPLTVEVAGWLAAKLARRREFVKECTKAKAEFIRPFICGNSREYRPLITLTPHLLDGVIFEEEV